MGECNWTHIGTSTSKQGSGPGRIPMIMVTENTFTSDPSTIRGLELEEVVHVISTKTKVSKKSETTGLPVRPRATFSPTRGMGSL